MFFGDTFFFVGRVSNDSDNTFRNAGRIHFAILQIIFYRIIQQQRPQSSIHV